MKTFIPYILILLLSASAFGWWQQSDYVPAEQIDVRVNEATRGISAELQSVQTMRDSLEAQNKELAERVEEQNEQIRLAASITGRLRIERDSLEQVASQPVPSDWNIAELPEPDSTTVLTFRQTFTDGLFQVRSDVSISGGQVRNELHLDQLRDLRINITVTERESGTLVFYSELPDFDQVWQEAYTPATEQKRAWYIRHWQKLVIGGLAGAVLLK